MKYGCIGERLKHSFSREIHNALGNDEYGIYEIEREALADFAKKRDFLGINVTIPYKELIMPYLDFTDRAARRIGAVNTVLNRGGKLYGYNTDYYGMSMLLEHARVDVRGKKVVILGTGGTSKTALAVTGDLGARETLRASRTANEDALSYEDIYSRHTDADIIINTTPVGMFPKISDMPIDLSRFPRLSGVIDAVYNPLCTSLVLDARKRGIAAEGGLFMLVAQAIRAAELFFDISYPEEKLTRIYRDILKSKENIVLIGMPASGKSTVGKLLSQKTGRTLYDTDSLITERAGKPISDIFRDDGESAFRDIEAEITAEVGAMCGIIISTGGGAVLRRENVDALRKNGRLYFIDRPPEALIPTEDRPLASTREAIEKRYRERYSVYTAAADAVIDASADADTVAKRIEDDFWT